VRRACKSHFIVGYYLRCNVATGVRALFLIIFEAFFLKEKFYSLVSFLSKFGYMAKIKKKLSASVKAARKEAKLDRQKKYETVFINGKQVQMKRPQLLEGIPVDEFIYQNSNAIDLHQNEMWEEIDDLTF
jgi:hypothetical protein